ncbi:MAG: glycosyltransferase [Chitinophagaceae bacterium]
MPKVSVIIPNYNHALYLEQRIETVFNQSWQDFEVIILDDCSTDNSRDIIERYRTHQKIKHIVYNDVNSGSTFKQWDKGIELCAGEFIWIAESDDWCEPFFLNEVMSGMLGDSNCVLGYCQSICIENDNKIKWQSYYEYIGNCIEGKSFIERHMLTNNAIFNASMAVWKREIFLKVSKEYMDYHYCGDWLFWIEVSRHGNVFVSGKLLNYFRKHKQDVSGLAIQSGQNFIEELTMFVLIYERKWISYGNLLESLKSEYVPYKAVARNLNSATRKRIEALFFTIPYAKSDLRSHYFSFYSKYAIRKIIKMVGLVN